MTIEQKAKAYDKAIKRANELNYVSDKDSLQRKTVEYIFPELVEQKPAEWSEENKKAFNDICENCCERTVEVVKNIMQSKQEWSEEDERTVHLACEFIRHHSTFRDSIGGIDCSALIERLKSLKNKIT